MAEDDDDDDDGDEETIELQMGSKMTMVSKRSIGSNSTPRKQGTPRKAGGTGRRRNSLDARTAPVATRDGLSAPPKPDPLPPPLHA